MYYLESGALQGIGAQDRALRQASMDMGYEDFMRQRDFSKRQLSDFSGMLRGVPVQPEAKNKHIQSTTWIIPRSS